MPQIGRKVRMAIQTRLANSTTGFNSNMQAAAITYGINDAPRLLIDYGLGSRNFMFGQIPPDIAEETSFIKYPAQTVDVIRSENQNIVKAHIFSGDVTAVVETHLSWPDQKTLPDFSSYADCAEDALFETFNGLTVQSDFAAVSGLLWNGQMSIQRGQIIEAGENWRQTIAAVMKFRVIAQ